jgi:hypothetical protein
MRRRRMVAAVQKWGRFSSSAHGALPASGPSTATAQFDTLAISPVSPGNQRSRSRRATLTNPMSRMSLTHGRTSAAPYRDTSLAS